MRAVLSRSRYSGVAVAALIAACTAATDPPPSPPVPALTSAMLPPAIPADAAEQLIGRVYAWQRTAPSNGPATVAADPEHYTLEFLADGRLALRADCNRGGGQYTLQSGGRVTISALATTKMACPAGSQDTQFLRALADAERYAIENRALRLTLARGAGVMEFSALAPR
jgi:heat shock protein HslJ